LFSGKNSSGGKRVDKERSGANVDLNDTSKFNDDHTSNELEIDIKDNAGFKVLDQIDGTIDNEGQTNQSQGQIMSNPSSHGSDYFNIP